MVIKCLICHKRIKSTAIYLQCSTCKYFFHTSCTTLTDSNENQNMFLCVHCTLNNLPFQNCFDDDFIAAGNSSNLYSSQQSFINKVKLCDFTTFENITHIDQKQKNFDKTDCDLSSQGNENNLRSSQKLFINENKFSNFNDLGNQGLHNKPFNFDNTEVINMRSNYTNIKEYNEVVDDKTFEIIHLNIASLKRHIDDLLNFVSCLKIKPKIIGITEHKIKKDSCLSQSLKGFTFVYTPTNTSHGGAGFFISDDLSYKSRPDLHIDIENCESIFIEVVLNKNKTIIIGCIYRHPNSSVNKFNEEFIRPLLSKLSQEAKLCCLLGDFNINLLKVDSNLSYSSFYELMCTSFFSPFILHPSRITETSKTLIDNIFLNTLEFETFSGNFEMQISDHLIQFLVLKKFPYSKLKCRNLLERNFKFFNHDEFHNDLLQCKWEDICASDDLDLNFQSFYDQIIYLLDEHAPLKLVTKKEMSLRLKPWITGNIRQQMFLRDSFFRKFCRSKLSVAKDEWHSKYRMQRNKVIFLIKESKKSYYQSFFHKNKHNISKVWEGIKYLIGKKNANSNNTPLALNQNGNLIVNLDNIVNIFNDFFVNIGPMISKSIPKADRHYSSYLNNINMNQSIYLKLTDEEEIVKIIKKLNNKKSTGPTSVPTNILKENVHILAKPISKLVNESFINSKFPTLLKTAKVLPLYKKGDKLDCSNYRPISLLSVFSKIFEKCMHSRIYNFLVKHSLIFKRQFGFRSKHSTSHVLIDLVESVKVELDKGNFACGVFIDLQKAFDTVNHEILLSKIKYYGLRGNCNEWLRSFLTERKQFVFINGHISDKKEILCGVPQGSTLGPLLFLLFINDLFMCINNGDVFHFADDTTILFKGNDFSVIQDKINDDMKLLVDWLRTNKLSINESKTELLIFRSTNCKVPKDFYITINDCKVFPQKFVKYVGIFLDEHLTWKKQISSLCIKLSKSVGAISKLRHFTSTKVCVSIYYALFFSHLSYGCLVWQYAHDSLIERICVLQRKVIRIISFSLPRDRTSPIFFLLKILKVRDVFDSFLLQLFFKLMNDELPCSLKKFFQSFVTDSIVFKKLRLPAIKSTKYGIKSLKFSGVKTWNKYFEQLRLSLSFSSTLAHIKISHSNICFESYL